MSPLVVFYGRLRIITASNATIAMARRYARHLQSTAIGSRSITGCGVGVAVCGSTAKDVTACEGQ